MLQFVAMVAQAQGGQGSMDVIEPRYYRLPISNWQLIGWRMAIGASTVAAMHLGVVAIVRYFCGIQMPVLIPILFLVLAVIGFQAILLLCMGHIFLRIAAGFGFGGALFYWASELYTINRSHPVAPHAGWTVVLSFIGAIAVMHVVAVIGAARVRRGDAAAAAGLREWWDRLTLHLWTRRDGFDSPAAAQLWFNRRTRGGAYVALIGMPAVFTAAYWTMGFQPRDLFGVSYGFSLFCLIGGAFPIGLYLGHCGKVKVGIPIDSFRATRPMSDRALAMSVVRSAVREIAWAWLALALLMLAVHAVVVWQGHTELIREYWGGLVNLIVFRPGNVISVFVAQWALIGIGMSLTMTGRTKAIGGFMWTVFMWVFSMLVMARYPSLGWYNKMFFYAVGATMLIAAESVLVAGWRRGYVKGWIAALPPLLAAAQVAMYLIDSKSVAANTLPGLAMAALFAALPFAAAPLAIAWNRHR
ncbi:hypothetical protein LLG95_13565 [bacterium]|nr:hypothetical protein [bacterium]